MLDGRKDSDPAVREAAVRVLGELAEDRVALPAEVVPALTAALSDDADGVISAAVQALGPFAAEATPAIPRLLELFESEAGSPAADAVARIGKPALPALVRMLKDPPGAPHTWAVARALGEMGPAAREAVPDLVRLRADRAVADYRSTIDEALKKIDPEAAARAGVPK